MKNNSRISLHKRNQGGFSLVELMVSMVIGLILVIAASSVYLYSKQSFNASTETSQLENNGRFAINLLTKYIQSAGFVMIDPTFPAPQGPIDNKISGCDFGMSNPTSPTTTADLACLTATPAGARRSASIALFSETDAYDGSGAKFQGFDCLGQSSIPIPTSTGQIYETRSYFFVGNTTVQTPNGSTTMGQLSCLADRTLPAGAADYQSQPIMPGIEQLAFSYLLPATADTNTAQDAKAAASLTTVTWPTVLAVDVCVLAKSIQAGGNDTGTSYTDCYGTAITASPGEIYRTFRTTVRLRNKSI
jgi:type IV pilus assembly protein PilW